MTDRELLKLAARSLGPDYVAWSDAYKAWRRTDVKEHFVPLRPLADPGDALRLATALHLHAKQFPIIDDDFGPPMGMVEVWRYDDEDPLHVEYLKSGDDRLAATMRAIVMASAEIERAKT